MRRKAVPIVAGILLAVANPAIAGIVLGGGDRTSYSERGDVNVGRIREVAVRDGVVVVDFPFGQWFLPATGREIDLYQTHMNRGVVFDRDLRPQWNAPVPAAEAASPAG